MYYRDIPNFIITKGIIPVTTTSAPTTKVKSTTAKKVVKTKVFDDSSIGITFMSVTEQAALDFKDILLENIPFSVNSENKYECVPSSHVTEDGKTHPFYKLMLWVAGDPEAVLMGLDDISNGMLSDSIDMIHRFSLDSLYSYLLFNNQEELLSSVAYLHTKSQSSSNEIKYLQQDYKEMKDVIESQQKQIEILAVQYSNLQAWLHSSIDLTKLKDVVIDLADKVDPDILDTFRVIQVH